MTGERYFFFFQEENGIRDLTVTGVKTCGLPISTERIFKKISGNVFYMVGKFY